MSVSEAVHSQGRERIELSEYAQREKKSWRDLGLPEERLSKEDHDLVAKLRGIGIIIDILSGGIQFTTNSFVGHVAFSTFDLVIRPKFEPLTTTDGKDSPLAALLAYAFGFDKLRQIGNQIAPETFFAEILIHWLLEEIRSIQRRGLFQQYRKERRDLSIIRGKFDVKTWLRRGGIPSETMPCVFYRRSLDNILNQTLCAGLRWSAAIASDYRRKECRFLADNFALSVTDRTLDYRMLADAQRGLSRLNAHYENAVKIIKLLYTGSGGFILGGPLKEQARIPGFFFDMNVLFESAITRFLKDNLSAEYEVKGQSKIRVFFKGNSKDPKIVKPDIIVSKNDRTERIVLDTKYKDIKDRISSADMYQLSIYALTCSHYENSPKRRARIIYPADHGTNQREIVLRQSKRIDQDEPVDLCKITICPVDLRTFVEMISKEKGERQQYALEIIGEPKE